MDIGSSFLPSDILAAILYAQLEKLDQIQKRRIAVWQAYYTQLQVIQSKGFQLPFVPDYAEVNGHLFHIVCPSLKIRTQFITYLKENRISAVFHYQPLHLSKFYLSNFSERPNLPNAEKYGDRLLRLPLYAGLEKHEVQYIIEKVISFCASI